MAAAPGTKEAGVYHVPPAIKSFAGEREKERGSEF
jgi:hypothetical protein